MRLLALRVYDISYLTVYPMKRYGEELWGEFLPNSVAIATRVGALSMHAGINVPFIIIAVPYS